MFRSTIAYLLFISVAGGQAANSEQRQAILNYPLSLERANQLLAALPDMTKHVMSLPNLKERMAKSRSMTPAQSIALVESDPAAMAILKQNNLTARDYLVGVPALRMSLLIASGQPQSDRVYASPANVAFAKANFAQLKPKMDAADGIPPK